MMGTAREAECYREGFAAYDPHPDEGEAACVFLQNPYIVGPGREAEAAAWGRGFQAARERARLTDRRAA